jgi:hypothetical protein
MISAGTFPAADISIGGKLRLWKRQTIDAWIEGNGPPKKGARRANDGPANSSNANIRASREMGMEGGRDE